MKSKTFEIIGLYQLLGGLLGIIITFSALLSSSFGLQNVFFFIFMFGYGYVTWAGGRLMMHKRDGLHSSYIAQAIQILHIKVLGISFLFTAGAYLEVYYSKWLVGFEFLLFSAQFNFNFSFDNGAEYPFFGFNLVPLVVIYLLYSKRDKLKGSSDSKPFVGDVLDMGEGTE